MTTPPSVSLGRLRQRHKRIFFSLGLLGLGRFRIAFGFFLLLPLAQLPAAQLHEARVSQVIKDVKLLPQKAAPRPAAIRDEVADGTAVRTGLESRAELTFTDQTLARLGANTIFSFNEGTRSLQLSGGAMLLRVPKNAGGAQINTAAITAAITGTTILLEYHPDAYIKFIVLEGTGRIFSNKRLGESVLLHAGQMLIVSPKGATLPEPVDVDLDRLIKTSALLGGDFAPIPSLTLIQREIQVQTTQKADKELVDTNLVIFGGGTIVTLLDPTGAQITDRANANPERQPTAPPTMSPTGVATYNGGTGNWSNAESWTPAFVPNNGNEGLDYDAHVSSGTLTQDVFGGVIIDQLFMSGGTLILANPLSLELGLQFSGGAITLGTLNLAGDSSQTAPMTVDGTTINNSGNYDITLASGPAFDGGNSTFNNSGTLTVNSLDDTVDLDIALNNSGIVAAASGTVSLAGGGTNSGTFSAAAGALLQIASDFTFTDGTHFAGAGTILFEDNTHSNLSGTITNDGNILLDSASNFTDFVLDGDVTLAGNGIVSLIGADRILGNGIFTNAGNTIQGETSNGGSLGANAIGIVNQVDGVIKANMAGLILDLDPSSTGNLINQGIMEATNGGILRLNGNGGGTFTNDGTIKALSGGALQFDGAVTSSGTVDVGGDSLSVTGSYTQAAGIFRLAGGTVTSTTALEFEGGLLDAWGTINATITNNANLQPGLGGTGLVVTGNISLLSASRLTFQLGGLTQGNDYGFLNVNGSVALGGQLVLSFANGFQNSITGNDSFTVLTASFDFSGVFTNVASGTRLNTSDGFGSFLVTYSGNSLILSNFLPAGSVVDAIWINGNGSWSDGTKWSSNPNFPDNGQPNSGDLYSATLANGSTITLDLPITIQNFTLSSGTVTGANSLTVNELFSWTGGTLNGGIVVNADGDLSLSGTDLLTLSGATLNSPFGQTATDSGAHSFVFADGAIFNNSGTFFAQNNNGLLFSGGTGSTFNNSGIFIRNVGTGTYTVNNGIAFNNSGTVDINSGIFALNGGGVSTGGMFNIANGAILRFNATYGFDAATTLAGAGAIEFVSGAQTINGAYNVTGSTSVSGGSVTFNNSVSIPTLLFTGGAINIAPGQTFSLTNLFDWTAGTLGGGGTFNAGAGLSLTGTNILTLNGATLDNPVGQLAIDSGIHTFVLSNGAIFNNAGTFLAQNNNGLLFGGGTPVAFNNTGTFTRTTGTDVYTISSGIVFNNSGTVNVNNGTLAFNGGYAQTAGTLNLAGGTVSSTSPLNLQGGLLTGVGNIDAAITNSALLRPGLGLGGLNVTGNVSLLSASQLSFQLGGLTQGTQYGFLNVNGTVALGGQLVLSFVNGFQDSVTNDDSFTILISSSAFTGAFDNVASGGRLATSDAFGSFLVTYSGSSVVLSDYMAFGGLVTSTWVGGTGVWSDPLGWDPSMVPNNGNNGSLFDVVFASGSLTQDIIAGVTIQQLQMSGGTLTLSNPLTLDAGLQFSGGTITGGILNIAGSSAQSALMGVNALTINNSGDYDITLVAGNAFNGGNSTFNNSGTLAVSSLDGTISFNILLINTGTVTAESGAVSLTDGGTNSGTSSSAAGAFLDFASNFSFTDGTHFAGDGSILFDNNTSSSFSGTVTNDGHILFNSTANFTDFVLNGAVTLAGSGTVSLVGADRILGNGILTNGGNTIEGETSNGGSLGANAIGIVNLASGVINANVAGLALNVDPNSSNDLTNMGLMEASNGGILLLDGNGGGGFVNTGGTITALDSSEVQLTNGATITGGTLSTDGSGLIRSLNTATLNSVTNAGALQVSNNTTVTLLGTITNSGSILLNSTVNLTDLALGGDITLNGGGLVTLLNSARIRGSGVLTNVDNTIAGFTTGGGSFGANAIGIVNQAGGLIDANASGLTLQVDPDSTNGLTNDGLMRASGGGILFLTGNGGGAFVNHNLIEALDGSQVQLGTGATIVGGTLLTIGSGTIQNLGSATLNGLTNAGTFIGLNNTTTTLIGTIVNGGSIALNSTVNFTDLSLLGDVTLNGGGTVVLANDARVLGSGILTTDNLIHGETNAGGSLGANAIGLINLAGGVINADVSGLILDGVLHFHRVNASHDAS